MGNTLKSFHLRNFKSYKDAEFSLSPITLIVGENASGKTNALEALRFMKRLAQGTRLDEMHKALSKRSPFIRGGVQGLFYPDTYSFEMEFVFGGAEEYKLQIAIDYNGESLVYAKEILTDSREKFRCMKLWQIVEKALMCDTTILTMRRWKSRLRNTQANRRFFINRFRELLLRIKFRA